MSCNNYILSGIPLDCGNLGGINSIWVNKTSEVTYIDRTGLSYESDEYFPMENNIDFEPNNTIIINNLSNNDIININNNLDETGNLNLIIYEFMDDENGYYDNIDKEYITFVNDELHIDFSYNVNTINVIDSIVSNAFGPISLRFALYGETDKITNISVLSKFKKYSFRKGNASMIHTNNVDLKNNTKVIKTDVNVKFNKIDEYKRLELTNLSKDDLYLIVKDNNGIYWFIGNDSYVSINESVATSGVEMGEPNQITVNFTSETTILPYQIDDTLVYLPDII